MTRLFATLAVLGALPAARGDEPAKPDDPIIGYAGRTPANLANLMQMYGGTEQSNRAVGRGRA